MKMRVKANRAESWWPHVWYFHCPLCPLLPSIGYPSSTRCHDAARAHARDCWPRKHVPVWALPLTKIDGMVV